MSESETEQLNPTLYTCLNNVTQYGALGPSPGNDASDSLRSNRASRVNPFRGGANGDMDDVPQIDNLSTETSSEWRLDEIPADPDTTLQACVFIEDASEYRSIHHRVDPKTLKLYRRYHSKIVQWILYVTILVLHVLAFIETPSSLTKTSDLRQKKEPIELPCGATEAIEILCLLIFLADCIAKSYFKGKLLLKKDKWLIAYMVVLTISFIDWFVSIAQGCPYQIRVRRMLRPFFLLQNSPLMKKTVKSIRRTLPQVASVLLLLLFHLYFFTMFGMLLFPKEVPGSSDPDYNEYDSYFRNIVDAFINMLVLLTTANNPDVTLPAYNVSRFYSIFFIVYLVVGLFCLMNMLTAVIYNQFRGYFMHSMQASLFRRRLGIRAAFEVLRRRTVSLNMRSTFDAVSEAVPTSHVAATLHDAQIPERKKHLLLNKLQATPRTMLNYEHFQTIFQCLDQDTSRNNIPPMRQMHSTCTTFLQMIFAHRYFTMLGCLVAVVNVIVITVELATEYEEVRSSTNTRLGILNLVLIPLYLLEQIARCWALGWRRYCYHVGNVFDAIVTISLVLVQIFYMAIFAIPYWGQVEVPSRGSVTHWDLVRIINMLILLKLLRVITTQVQAMFIVSSTLLDLIKNLKAFAGLLAIAFYSYALLGMVFFSGKIKYEVTNSSSPQANISQNCGTYEQLDYWSNNFDDFAAALVVLWNVMIVNNWHVFLSAYSRYINKWSQLYFIVWWLISVVVALNLFTALILENFIMRWDRAQQMRSGSVTRRVTGNGEDEEEDFLRSQDLTIHDIFRNELQEPSEESLMTEIQQHPHLSLHRRR